MNKSEFLLFLAGIELGIMITSGLMFILFLNN